ncbi:MAG: EamA family transporter [Verrucomicrobiota bacterium]
MSHPSRLRILLAFATVYLVWGSTYLGMRVAVSALPPFFMAGVRFLIAGGVLFAFLRWRGAPWPPAAHWKYGAISGFFLLVTGNGLVVWAEQTVPSGLASLLVAVAPAWFALIDWLRPGGSRPTRATLLGIVIGFAGVALLVGPSGASGRADIAGAVALLAAGLSWAGGSLYAKHATGGGSPWMNAALQMICGGAALLLTGLAVGDFGRLDWQRVTARGLGALAYLVVFGSWVGYSAYIWLLKVCKPAHVATYAYVNPVIAVLLGALILGEPLTARVFVAAALILAGVVVTTLPARPPASAVVLAKRMTG